MSSLKEKVDGIEITSGDPEPAVSPGVKFIRRYRGTARTASNLPNGCCNDVDRQTIDFAIRMMMILLILIFSMVQVWRVNDVNQKQIYFGIITSILGYLIPSPTLKK